ncbi:hypothetical protein LWM68_23480 [Niabella sp. W65]|nr:hypothetical protein [Niabella sp. W65]MCH7365474.1 hypothetical protein [Niabella sp. W65]
MIKALKVLKSEVDKDMATKPEYLENRFITEDGFEVAYFISNEKVTWCIKLEKYGSDNTIFLKSGDDIEVPFNEARNKIEELKMQKKYSRIFNEERSNIFYNTCSNTPITFK